jgi:hypothetical protein
MPLIIYCRFVWCYIYSAIISLDYIALFAVSIIYFQRYSMYDFESRINYVFFQVCSICCPLPCASESANPSAGLAEPQDSADPQESAEQILNFADPRDQDSSYLEAVLKEPASEGSEIADTGKARTKSVEAMVVKQRVIKRCRLCWLTNSALVYAPKCESRGPGGGGGLRGLRPQPMSTAVHMKPK